jgi:hypothetical protein
MICQIRKTNKDLMIKVCSKRNEIIQKLSLKTKNTKNKFPAHKCKHQKYMSHYVKLSQYSS